MLGLAALGVSALVAGAAAPRTGAGPAPVAKSSFPPLLGISFRTQEPYRGTLAWFEPETLRALPGRKVPLRQYYTSWAFSADRATLAIASCNSRGVDLDGIRFVNARAMRVLGDVPLSRSQVCVGPLAWLRPDRLLAVLDAGRVNGRPEVVVVDPVARRVLGRGPLPSYRVASATTSDELVLMLGTWGSFAPTRLAVVDAAGTVRVLAADRVLQGTVVDEQADDHRARTLQPGLAVDPEGRRAFLVPPSGPVAEIDLQTLAVSYHELGRPSLLDRFLGWLTPSAVAKVTEGPTREARWLGDGMIALSGTDYSIVAGAEGDRVEEAPAGLELIDTRSWTSRTVSRDASGFVVAQGLVITHGGTWDARSERSRGPGLLAFDLAGRERWRLHPGIFQWLDAAGRVGYAHAVEGRAEVVDLETGGVLRTLTRNERKSPWPRLLGAQASDW